MSEDLPHQRLKLARIRAGYRSAAEAAKHHGWPIPTYSGRENGGRGFDAEVARVYGEAFAVDPAWLLLGEGVAAPAVKSAAVSLTTESNGKARLQLNKVLPMALALQILALIEGDKT